jgi:hypothetical protein
MFKWSRSEYFSQSAGGTTSKFADNNAVFFQDKTGCRQAVARQKQKAPAEFSRSRGPEG